ncbi:phosphoglycolate phosphatase [Xenorhabdus nematophila]|uniref:Phosphoglycolate phosphatase n=1 Tax=Xenorhabdus nematophila (strain ATCC 19061 / DSM 3370 / CCUG 14189 / LMG 1036 / NCIMB 9965 / AN6) TaxID=406817 RepID=D3VG55_XENNA|nr:phosphoglycolate phosphatase [Xenorhabdus nematophila]CEE91206.1 phosphoglycolate phosphatase, contains a phosphatase-like domain [Xenorhabdus nematophila str. Anatoliense]CEF29385.1 phosphoglycolate phosphatase, contains a phosphatase-like domain [Xenorhabdus nematophila str. Websteri]AYA41633.1 phosphoglycolate phosphatase [Xenorhabdus nematophila]KHD28987.1 phosphoglycolate phosphatase [Xenorhabdus nematophila]MBA0020372.1 phosphoglycolate phosphatase [Xenorhabdus nematophila]
MLNNVVKKIRAIAFDLDGTLVDSADGLADALDQALIAKGLPAAGKDQVAVWIGNGADIMVERALKWAGAEPSPELHRETRKLFDTFYETSITTGSKLFPQVKETLAELAKHRLPMAIITNKPTPFIAPLLESLGISEYFSVVLGGDDVKEKKPHPAPLYLTMGMFGLHKEELLFVGDSRNDILAAQSAGCPCVGLTYGYNYGESIALSHPTYVLDHFSDLFPTIGLSTLNLLSTSKIQEA